jgi:chromate transport protein ChrA
LQPHEWAPRVLVAILLAVSAAGWIVSMITPLVAGVPGHDADSGMVATIRTAALALAAVALGRFGRDARFRESLWLLYPVLAAGGLKLLFEDFPQSKPATLFLALALYGGALIVAPRLSRRRA